MSFSDQRWHAENTYVAQPEEWCKCHTSASDQILNKKSLQMQNSDAMDYKSELIPGKVLVNLNWRDWRARWGNKDAIEIASQMRNWWSCFNFRHQLAITVMVLYKQNAKGLEGEKWQLQIVIIRDILETERFVAKGGCTQVGHSRIAEIEDVTDVHDEYIMTSHPISAILKCLTWVHP